MKTINFNIKILNYEFNLIAIKMKERRSMYTLYIISIINIMCVCCIMMHHYVVWFIDYFSFFFFPLFTHIRISSFCMILLLLSTPSQSFGND